MRYLLLIFLVINYQAFASDDKNGGKETSRTILIKITDTSGEELAGAKVKINDSEKEFITSFNGQVQLIIPANKPFTLKIQSLGFEELIVQSPEIQTFNNLSLHSL